MPLPKLVAAIVSLCVLGAQIAISSPISPERHGWYWPFLPYPMYAESHARTDSLVVPELRAAACGSEVFTSILTADSLTTPRNQLVTLLVVAARDPEGAAGKSAEAKLSGAIEAQYPARYCTASAWIRVAHVADTSTYHVRAPMRRAAVWAVNEAGDR
jgi:hypothetical protein